FSPPFTPHNSCSYYFTWTCVYTVALTRGGLGWGNSRTGSDSITGVYTVALVRGGCRKAGGVFQDL
ncbi:MAG: hypothetical protein RMY35_031135, partial [Nostoc sp. DedSLP01]